MYFYSFSAYYAFLWRTLAPICLYISHRFFTLSVRSCLDIFYAGVPISYLCSGIDMAFYITNKQI